MSSENDASSANRGGGPRQNYELERIEVADRSSSSRTVGGTAIGNFTKWYEEAREIAANT